MAVSLELKDNFLNMYHARFDRFLLLFLVTPCLAVAGQFWPKKLLIKKLFIACRRNKNLQQVIRGNCILKNKEVHKNNENHKQLGTCSPSVSPLKNFCFK